MAEPDRLRLPAVLAADPDVEVGTRLPTGADRQLHQPPDAFDVEHLERVVAQNAELAVVWREVDIRQPWPTYGGRCAAIAERLVAWLAETEARRGELARICSWRAAISWSSLLERIRDRPYREPDGEGLLYQLPGQLVWIQFRPRRRRGEREERVVELADAALAQVRLRARRYRGAQGLHGLHEDERQDQRPQPMRRR